MTPTILCYGEILWDLLPGGRRLGGAPFNLAARLAASGCRAVIASRVGDDDPGRDAVHQARELGVETSLLQTDPELPTGTVDVTIADGEPEFRIIEHVAWDRIDLSPALLETAGTADCVCFGTLAQRSGVSRRSLHGLLDAAPHVLAFCDINLRADCYGETTVRASMERADVLKLNEAEVAEAGRLIGLPADNPVEFCRMVMADYAPRLCVVTLGQAGALAVPGYSDAVYAPGYRVEVADTVGCGDAFSAGLLNGLLAESPLPEALESACRLGAATATVAGGTARIDGARLPDPAGERVDDPRFADFRVDTGEAPDAD